nr:arginase family protein [Microbacterium bovistercoris]
MTTELIHFAGRAGDRNDRGMVGAAVLAAVFVARTSVQAHVVGEPALALNTDWATELDAARSGLRALAARLDAVLATGAFPTTVVPRCAAALATLPVLARHRPDAVVIWADAHADLNTPQSSRTGYLGGMALSGPLGLWDSGHGAGLAAANAILLGARDLDPAERALVDDGAIALIPPGPDIARRLTAAVAGRPVYLHLDCDVLEPGLIPTDYRVTGGLSLADLRDVATVLASSCLVGVELGEFESALDPVATRAAAESLLDALQPIARGY